MTVKRTLIVGFTTLAALGLVQGTAALLGSRQMQRSMTAQVERLQVLNLATSAQLALERADSAAQGSRRAAGQEEARALADRFRTEVRKLQASLRGAARLNGVFDRFIVPVTQWSEHTDLRLPGSEGEQQTRLLRADVLSKRLDVQQRDIRESVTLILQDATKANSKFVQLTGKVQRAIFGLVAVSCMAAVLLTVLLWRRVLRPLSKLTSATQRLTLGLLEESVTDTNRRDEIGDIAKALEGLRRSTLQARVQEAEEAKRRSVAEADLRYLAQHDTLTGLANRAMFNKCLNQALEEAHRSGSSLALHYIDLDRFKVVNDSRGHAAGDILLREVSRRLRSEAGKSDTVARLGGDEFVVIQPAAPQPGGAQALAARMCGALEQPYDLSDGQSASISASVGIAIYPEDGNDAGSLLASADLALYRVKHEGRNGHAFFSAAMDTQMRLRQCLEQDLRFSQARNELFLVYQPLLDLSSSEIVAFEALLRWRHPERGLIPPDTFIPAAEVSGLIVQIGTWVLQAACAEAAGWAKPHRVSVNVSPAQFLQSDVAKVVADALNTTGLPPSRLELEITEGVLIEDLPRTGEALRRIRAMGVTIAIDDFGTGYSSLATLRAFAFDRLKLDRSFIADMLTNHEAAAIVQAAVTLAHGLVLPVVAEGVETIQQLEALKLIGCSEVQGFWIGPPRPIESYQNLTSNTGSEHLCVT